MGHAVDYPVLADDLGAQVPPPMNERPIDLRRLELPLLALEAQLRIKVIGARGDVTYHARGGISGGGGNMEGAFDGVSMDAPSFEETISQALAVEIETTTGFKSKLSSVEFAELAPLLLAARRYVFVHPQMIAGSPSAAFDLAPVPTGVLSTSTSTGIEVAGKNYVTTWARPAVLSASGRNRSVLIASVMDTDQSKKLSLYLVALAER